MKIPTTGKALKGAVDQLQHDLVWRQQHISGTETLADAALGKVQPRFYNACLARQYRGTHTALHKAWIGFYIVHQLKELVVEAEVELIHKVLEELVAVEVELNLQTQLLQLQEQ